MARSLRIEYPGAFYHAYSRGLERRELFRDDRDYRVFLNILTQVHKRTAFLCHSYCLMPNHYHLYLETPQGNLSQAMKDINGHYTQYYNRRYRRAGPLFQGRYKAKLIDKDSYSLQLSRYIHLNPVKARLARRPGGWRWSSYRAFMAEAEEPEFLVTGWILEQLNGNRKRFEEFVLNGMGDTWSPLDAGGHGPVLGTEEFVAKIKRKFVPQERNSDLSGLRELRKDDRVREVCGCAAKLDCDNLLRAKLLLYGLRRFTALSLKEAGEHAGGMKPVAVSQAVRRLEIAARADKQLARLIQDLVSNVKI